jgi:hypothetical protein
MVRNNQMRQSDTISFLNMPDNGMLYESHDWLINVQPRKRLYHKVTPGIVADINAGLRVKLVKGPMNYNGRE